MKHDQIHHGLFARVIEHLPLYYLLSNFEKGLQASMARSAGLTTLPAM